MLLIFIHDLSGIVIMQESFCGAGINILIFMSMNKSFSAQLDACSQKRNTWPLSVVKTYTIITCIVYQNRIPML